MALFRKKRRGRHPSALPPTGRGWIEGALTDASINEGTFSAFDEALRFYPIAGEVRTIGWQGVGWPCVESLTTILPEVIESHPWVFGLPSDSNLVTGWIYWSEVFVIATTSDHPASKWIATMRRAGVEIK
jgi:hypothetical protein